MKARASLTESPVGPLLIRLTIPMAVALLGRVAFNLVDAFFVGRLGTAELAAMGFTFPVVLIVTSLSLGLGVGTSAVVSKAIGQRDFNGIRRLTTDSLSLSVIVVAVIALAGILTIRPLFRLLGAEEETLFYIVRYMRIWYLGVPVVVVPMVGNSAIRATGDTRTPMLIMLISVAINIFLDPFLIFGIGPFPRMEIAGAALATVISRFASLLISLYILTKREKMVLLQKASAAEIVASWKRILFIGIPAALTNMIVPMLMGFVTRLVAEYGASAVAGLGVASRIEMFVLMVQGALASVLIPFVGQNWGAKNFLRIRTGMKLSFGFSIFWGALNFLVFLFASRPIAGLFNPDELVVDTVHLYLVVVSTSYGFFGIMRLAASAMNALNKPLHSTIISVARMLLFFIPLGLLGRLFFDLEGLFAGAAIANIASGILSFVWLRYLVGKIQNLADTKKGE